MNAPCCLVQLRDLLKYDIALPGDVGFTGLSLERQHRNMEMSSEGALTDLVGEIC